MRIIFATHPLDGANEFAAQLVNEDLARCVQVQPAATSIYRWNGAIHEDQEAVLIIKAPTKKIAELRTRFLQLHPYEVAEFLPLEVNQNEANPAYLKWIEDA